MTKSTQLSILLLLLSLLATAAPAAEPAPTGTRDITTGLYHAPDPAHLPAISIAICGSASTSIRLATWKLSDSSLATALCLASTRGVNVQVAYDLSGSSTTIQNQLIREIKLSGGTCWSCHFPPKIANNFLTADGTYTALGNYYYSPTAVQIGSYLLTVSGTPTAAAASATFASLVSGGTLAASAPPPPTERTIARVDITTPQQPPAIETTSHHHRSLELAPSGRDAYSRSGPLRWLSRRRKQYRPGQRGNRLRRDRRPLGFASVPCPAPSAGGTDMPTPRRNLA